MDGQMLYEAVEEIVRKVYPVKSIDDVSISKSIRTNRTYVLDNITKITVVLCAADKEFEGSCVSCVFNPDEFPDKVTPGVKMRIKETLQQELNRFMISLVASQRKEEEDADRIIYNTRMEHNLEWDDIHDVRELCVILAEKLVEERKIN